MRLCICGAVALLAVLVFRTKTVRDAVARLAALWCGASRWARFGVIAFVTGFVLYAGTKTNSPPAGVMMPFLPPLHDGALGDRALPVVVTPEEIAQGWRLVAETNCDADIYAMPDGITPSFNWHKRGTFGEWARLDLGDFAFPLGTNDGAVTCGPLGERALPGKDSDVGKLLFECRHQRACQRAD